MGQVGLYVFGTFQSLLQNQHKNIYGKPTTRNIRKEENAHNKGNTSTSECSYIIKFTS